MMNSGNHRASRLKLQGWRARLVLVLLLFGFVALAGRATYLQGLNEEFLQRKGEARYSRVMALPAYRGVISDRHGEPLAISTPMESVIASPAEMQVSAAQMNQLSGLLKLPVAELQRRLEDKSKTFVYLKRQIPPAVAQHVSRLRIAGLWLQREYRRYYPAGAVTSQLVGFTDVEDRGQEGVELAYQGQLAGTAGAKRVIKDRDGRTVEDVGNIRLPQDGRAVNLSIDSKIQYLAHRELRAAVQGHRAKAGSIVVLDISSGEILALGSVPDFNPNDRAKLDPKLIRNRAITDIFEPGSTLKPFTVALAIERGTVNARTRIQTAPGYLTVADRTIRDAHPHGELTVEEIIQKSSNVGAAKIALELPKREMWGMFNELGFGRQPQIGFPGAAAGKVRPFEIWRPIEQATMSYGHGISVSLLQLARAYMVFAAGGVERPLSILKQDVPPEGTRIFSARTAEILTVMLEKVVQPGGTAPRAHVQGYRVAGKTGTAHKQVGARYASDRYISSFIGYAPVSNPKLLIAVMVDEPSAGEYYGGSVAAPVFSRVMGEALRMLSIAPDAPLQEWTTPLESVPEVKEEA